MTPRILFNDKNLTRTENDLLSLIISLALKNDYCYANNKYLADYINTSDRTISYSLSKLKELNYIFIKKIDGKRRIYLNKEKIPTKNADDVATDCSNDSAIDCGYNINNKYKKEYNNKFNKFKREGIVPEWMKHPELCVSTPATKEEQEEMQKEIDEAINKINEL
ncbi:MAG: helix-turn-helix domain-containing protein [Bacilli bacterium]|nr:helix-turn-helix domain-containing protein [Bacilli bacterium]